MNRQLFLISAMFVLGVAAGAALMISRDDNPAIQHAAESVSSAAPPDQSLQHPMANAFTASREPDKARIQLLEEQVRYLNARLDELEQKVTASVEQRAESDAGTKAANATSMADTPITRQSPMLTTDNLVKSGIDPVIAVDIVRRKNDFDLKLLELRDRAMREGYLGTGRYQRELNALMVENVVLRDEIGDDAYDRYLFATGQRNRVKIASVMMGSPAEQAGLKTGDMILSYNDRQMFDWNELQDATTKGERGEYVNVTVMRNGQLMNIWLPRGPLGVRLGTVRVRP
ncbi:MAG: PDZ domain-containing protein [Gammaproteobacteria bacterium]|jgi:outer membrane murein-binding lipoprotein Lpp